jgi:hypothetical protein
MELQPDLPAQSTPDPLVALAKLQRQTDTLWWLFHAAVAGVLVFTFGVNFYLLKQVRIVRNQASQERMQISRMTAEFQKVQEPVFRNFASRLLAYGYSHREFLPVIDRYRTVLERYFPPLPPLQSPAVAPAMTPGGEAAMPAPPTK